MTPVAVQLTDTSTGTVDSYLWDFGDGTQSTAANPIHVFPPGIYTVKLTTYDADGFYLSKSKIISIDSVYDTVLEYV